VAGADPCSGDVRRRATGGSPARRPAYTTTSDRPARSRARRVQRNPT